MAYLGEEIKKLGFGLMRLPQKSEGVIDGADQSHGRQIYGSWIYLL